ncbi:MAG: APC family permease [Candidatus Aminicenantales bacterium]
MRRNHEEENKTISQRLGKEIKARHLFTIGFGCIIGVGWIIILGDWLEQAGPLGSILAFAVGAVVMMIVGLCYAEMATMMPVSGGEIAYSYEIYGLKSSFIMGWFLSLAYISAISFEAISAAWIFSTLFKGLKGPFLYAIRGDAVLLGTLLFALGGTIFLTFLNYRGIKEAAVFQEIMTYGLICISLIFIIVGLIHGDVGNLEPVFSKVGAGPIILGILAVFIVVPFMYAGFNVIPQVMEEKASSTPLRLAGKTILFSIGGATIFYLLVILAASIVVPWQSLLSHELPAAGAFEAALKSPFLAKMVLVAGLMGIVTTWNSVFIAASRIIFALGRARIIPSGLGKVHSRLGTPFISIFFVGGVACLGIFMGRSAILPIVNVAGGCFAFAFTFTCLGVLKLRRTKPELRRPYRAPGGMVVPVIGFLVSIFMVIMTLYQPYASSKGSIPMEWIIIIVWAALGILFWVSARKIRIQVSERERRKLILGSLADPGGQLEIQ